MHARGAERGLEGRPHPRRGVDVVDQQREVGERRDPGSAGAPAAAASARTMRSTAASTRTRTSGSKVLMLIFSSARSGMMFSLLPACSEPTVTTTESAGATSRATIVCSRSTIAAAITTGSTVAWGVEPWPPRPCTVTRRLSAAAMNTPPRA